MKHFNDNSAHCGDVTLDLKTLSRSLPVLESLDLHVDSGD